MSDWKTPTNVEDVHKFIGLASHYRQYIQGFSDIAKPLYSLTLKQAQFTWSDDCDKAFNALKNKLVQASVLAYPQFDLTTPVFVLQINASFISVDAILKKGGRVIAYASRALNQAEQQYSVVQKEYLAIVFALKQFRHYLLGRSFEPLTDHAPLQWLSSQKMEGLLCRWALAMQEFDFVIKYHKDCQNGNANALSWNLPAPPVVAASYTVYSWPH